jgi:hypothetical protein
MMVAFLLNGLSPFGLKILAAQGLGATYNTVYLFFWYLTGLAFAVIWFLLGRQKLNLTTVVIGTGMAGCSVGGQVCMGLALSRGVPGNIVFTLAMGCSICLVAAGGILLFHERVGIYGKVGVLLGLIAAVLLSVWG